MHLVRDEDLDATSRWARNTDLDADVGEPPRRLATISRAAQGADGFDAELDGLNSA